MNALIAIGVLTACLAGAFVGGMEWQQGRDAIALAEARKGLKKLNDDADKTAINHAEALDRIGRKLGATRAQLADLTTGRPCLSADAVRLLNGAGIGVPAAASQPASQAEASATDRDVGTALATCRAGYESLAAQLDGILDIEDRRAGGRALSAP